MEHASLYIDHLGMGFAPENWSLSHRIKMQRLYYILGGTGYFKAENDQYEKMEHGKIYVFPYNFYSEFKSEKNDPINHIYFDFISSPPIISDRPIVYDVREDSKVFSHLKFIEKLLSEFALPKMTENKISHITSAKSGTFDEQRQIVYYALYQMLLLLSNIREIPFLNDSVVSDAINYIRNNIDGDLSIEALSKKFNFEKHYFIKHFKAVMNETPHFYIKKYRLLRAREFLAEGMGYKEVARKVGYKTDKSLWNAVNSEKKLN